MLQLRYILYNSEFAAASSYYLQAATIWPSSGNPHHQVFGIPVTPVLCFWLFTFIVDHGL